MLKNHLLIALRILLRQKTVSLINLFGLSIGVACCLLLLMFVEYERSYDSFHEHASRIFRLVSDLRSADGSIIRTANQPLPLSVALSTEYPEIKHAVRVMDGRILLKNGEKVFTETALFTDSDFFDMFSFSSVQGDMTQSLVRPDGIVLSSSMATRLFGMEECLGRQVGINVESGFNDFVVTGVVHDVPGNSSLKFNVLLPITRHPGYPVLRDNWSSSNANVFVELSQSSNPRELTQKLPPLVWKFLGDRIRLSVKEGSLATGHDAWQLGLQRLEDIHLTQGIRGELEPTSSPLYSLIVAALALVILIIACVNFVSLSLARTAARALEVGMRKVLGANTRDLMRQFWSEAFVMTALALMLGLVLAELMLPAFNRLAAKELSFGSLLAWRSVPGVLAIMTVLALAAGWYPISYLSRFQPVQVLKGEVSMARRLLLPRLLVAGQFVVSLSLIICTLTMHRQLDFLSHRSLGYEADQVVVIPNQFGNADTRLIEVLRQELSTSLDIMSVSSVNNSFTRGGMTATVSSGARSVDASVFFVGADFIRTMGIKLIDGADFQSPQAPVAIMNQSLAQALGWTSPVGRQLQYGKNPIVTGVCQDFNFRSLHTPIGPALLYYHPAAGAGNILVKINRNDLHGAISSLEAAWKKVAPELPFDFYFLDEDVQLQYAADQRWGTIVTSAAGFAILIGALGLFGLAALSIVKRTKEIGIRKVLGSSVAGIILLFTKEYVTLILVAAVLAVPLSAYIMTGWLDGFAYRVNVDVWTYVTAVAFCLVVALVAAGHHILKAATANPVEALRYE